MSGYERQQRRALPATGRWALLTSDGRHQWLGRVQPGDTPEALIERLGADAGRLVEALQRRNLDGWLVAIDGLYYRPDPLRLSGGHRITAKAAALGAAVERFHEIRRQALDALRGSRPGGGQ
jgi:hypothetical protein